MATFRKNELTIIKGTLMQKTKTKAKAKAKAEGRGQRAEGEERGARSIL